VASMKVLLALALTLAVVTVSDARRQGRQRPGRQQKPKEDPGTIIRCMAENFGQEDRIQECRDCFKNLEGEFMSAGWITAAKQCAADYWPQLVQECSTEIAAMTAGDMESGGEVVECFDEALETRNYERCLNEADASGSDEEKLTDGAMCVMESWKFGMEYIKNATQPAKQFRPRPGGRRPRGRGGKGGKRGGKGKKKFMMKMLTIAHCQNANEGDEAKQDQCTSCFKDAVKNAMKKGSKPDTEAMKSGLSACATQYLDTKYAACNALMQDASSDKKEGFECYIRELVKSLVQKCSAAENISGATAESLDSVMECGKDEVKQFVMENAGPKALKVIGNMLGKDDDSSEEDD